VSNVFDGEEVAAVLAAALLALDDNAPPLTVVVQTPSGVRQRLVRAWYEPGTNELILDLFEEVRHRQGVEPSQWDPNNVDWVADMISLYPRRSGRNPLNDITRGNTGDAPKET
jgi:hypothetical protein